MFDLRHSEFQVCTHIQEFNSFACYHSRLMEGPFFNYSQALAALVPFLATVERNAIANSFCPFNPVTASNINLNAGFITADLFQSSANSHAFDTITPGLTTVAFFKINFIFNNINTVADRCVQHIFRIFKPALVNRGIKSGPH